MSKNGPYIVTGSIPLIKKEIRNDAEGYCSTWHDVETYPLQEQYALCRCGNSKNKPFCDGTHTKIHFNGTETADDTPISGKSRKNYRDLHCRSLMLIICVSMQGFACGLVGSGTSRGNQETLRPGTLLYRRQANCPSGRLVVWDKKTGEALEPEFEKSIVIIEYPPRSEHGPLWVRGGIPVESSEGHVYEIRNRVTLCRCGKSYNKPFCDGSHVER